MLRRFVKPIFALISLIGIGVLAATYPSWLPLFRPAPATAKESDEHDHDHEHRHEPVEQVKLSPQAQSNLKLVSKPLKVESFWRTLDLPGTVIDRPGFSDRGVVTPVTGVVTKVHRFPGDTVRPGDVLFTMKILSESFHLSQTELFKATRDIEITEDSKARLMKVESIPPARIVELENQIRRSSAAAQAYRQDLQTRGLTPDQIEQIAKGKFVSETVVMMPKRPDGEMDENSALDAAQPIVQQGLYEVQELKAELGQQVQAGQTLCLLSYHRALYIEGRGFRQEIPLLQRAALEGWPIETEFSEQNDGDWPAIPQTFAIRHISNTINPETRTFSFFIPLTNQSKTYERDGRTLFLWRFRPGQRVRLKVRTDRLENVFVLSADAVVQEGPEAYVFRQNGDLFDRKPVRVLYQDRGTVVIANDGSVPPGIYVAQNGATQLNRVLKAQTGTATPGVHVHPDGTVHANH